MNFSFSQTNIGIWSGSIGMLIARKTRALKSSHPSRAQWALICLALACAPLTGAADDAAASAPSALSLHGFGTLGIVRSDNDNVQFIRDLSQPQGAGTQWSGKVDSLLGIQANFRFSPRTEAVVQAVSRYHATDSYDAELTWAFLRHDFSSDFSLRAGRLGTEFYMLGDSRLVGYSNISVRPPPDFYGSLVFSYIDGLDVSATLPLATGLLKGKLFAGQSAEKASFAPGIPWNLQGSSLVGGYLDYQTGPWQLRLSQADVKFNQEQPVDALLRSNGDPLSGFPYLMLVPTMTMADQVARFQSLGLVYDQGPLNIQWMVNQIRHDSPAYADSKAGYLLAAYRWGAVTPYLGVSRSLTSPEPLPSSPIPGVDAVTASLVDHSVVDQHTYTLGGRWDMQKNLAVKAQVDWIRGKPASIFLFKEIQPGWSGSMTVFSLALDFVF